MPAGAVGAVRPAEAILPTAFAAGPSFVPRAASPPGRNPGVCTERNLRRPITAYNKSSLLIFRHK